MTKKRKNVLTILLGFLALFCLSIGMSKTISAKADEYSHGYKNECIT